MKNKLLLALPSTNTCFANEIFFFEQVTVFMFRGVALRT